MDPFHREHSHIAKGKHRDHHRISSRNLYFEECQLLPDMISQCWQHLHRYRLRYHLQPQEDQSFSRVVWKIIVERDNHPRLHQHRTFRDYPLALDRILHHHPLPGVAEPSW
jgi:hypothetical protein